ncbi:MAG: SLBB domain-containing protein [Desulfovibrio sp.]|jgi:Na+-translocating ferredoxin:NAD+ oxidoreductase RnfC subunit|nr:SLBB domain-containing protein [Desulfovibrio sp.]
MKQQIIEKIRNAGVVGAGGAGLPAHVKADAAVDTVLVNGASCEPLLMSDPYLLEAEIETVVSGLRTLMECTGAARGILCLKGKHGAAMRSARAAAARHAANGLEVAELEDFYPAGDEHVLVHEVLGRTVPERGIPLRVGAVVSNVESLYNIALAMRDEPVTDRYLTVTGEVRRPMVVKAPIGAPVRDVLDFAGGPVIADYAVVDGGPMMGRVLSGEAHSVTKTTSGLLVLPKDHAVVTGKVMDPERLRRITATVCCQCSQCTDLCPRNLLGHSLHPHKLMRAAGTADFASASIAREALLCSECGVCEKFACPMKVSPREVNALIKKTLTAEGATWESRGNELAAHMFRKERRIPTARLVRRLNLERYDGHPAFAGAMEAPLVRIPLRQHIGAPSLPVVAVGDIVRKGCLVGEIPQGTMAARVHAGIGGEVVSVADGMITIKVR